jgi:RNA polymerase sigma-70 factor (ECF subfamily)
MMRSAPQLATVTEQSMDSTAQDGPRTVDPALARTERLCIERALSGSGQAFAALVRPHLPMLHRVATRTCSDPTMAEDAVQETLTVVFQDLRRYTPGTSLRAFLAAIAVRRAHSLIRSERRRRRREVSAAPAQTADRPDELLAASRIAARVREVLASMPSKRRQAAMLRLDGGLSYQEIAESLNTSPGSSRVLVHLAIKQLRDQLSDLLPTPRES